MTFLSCLNVIMSSWSPSSLDFTEHISDSEPEFLRIVKKELDFCKNTYFWGLISCTNPRSSSFSPINQHLTAGINNGYDAPNDRLLQKFGSSSDYTNSPLLMVIDKYLEYFNTPMKIIECSDPDEYLYGVRSLCDGFFKFFIAGIGRSTYMYRYNTIVTEFFGKLNEEIPFSNDDGTLQSFVTNIESFMNVSFSPSQYKTDWNDVVKSMIYTSYYPYFVFLYISSFVISDSTSNFTKKRELTFKESRKAKVSCYLFIAHISFILFTALSKYSPSSEGVESKNQKLELLKQIMINVSSNILERERTEYGRRQEDVKAELEKLSKDNVVQNNQIISENNKYERYKQNLLSALNSERSVDEQLISKKRWMKIHMWLLVFIVIVTSILLIIPKNKIPKQYDLQALYIICGFSMLYCLVLGMIGAIRMLK